ncbi:hypothetical protein SUGI_0552030 [Cryptomeria japonica]|nr:hypothetical protein SUGI_0552030 [Cryptomeria japonica]
MEIRFMKLVLTNNFQSPTMSNSWMLRFDLTVVAADDNKGCRSPVMEFKSDLLATVNHDLEYIRARRKPGSFKGVYS